MNTESERDAQALREEAQRGNPRACAELAKRAALSEGGMEPEANGPDAAQHWIDTGLALAHGDTAAEGHLRSVEGALLAQRRLPNATSERAVATLESAGALGIAEAWTAAGWLRLTDPELAHSSEEAMTNAFERGAEAGDPGAMHRLGLWLWDGRGPVAQDQARGHALLEEAAKRGDPRAMTDYGTVRAAEAREGDPHGWTEALMWFDRAAPDNATAAFNLGACHEHGWGTEPSAARARAAYAQAARSGEARAWRALAEMIEQGKTEDNDPTQAARCLQAAGLEGDAVACNRLAERYDGEPGTEGVDHVQSLAWSRLATEGSGHDTDAVSARETSQKRAQRIGPGLNDAQRTECERLIGHAKQWRTRRALARQRDANARGTAPQPHEQRAGTER